MAVIKHHLTANDGKYLVSQGYLKEDLSQIDMAVVECNYTINGVKIGHREAIKGNKVTFGLRK